MRTSSSKAAFWSLPLCGRLVFLSGLIGLSSAAGAEPSLSIDQLCDRMRTGDRIPGSFTGTETIAIDHIGVRSPDLSNYVIAGYSTEGAYRWYVHDGDWWMTKDVPVPPKPGKWSGTNRYILRNYGDQVLRNTDFRRDDGQHFFLSAHLDRMSDWADDGPMAGRRFAARSIADILQATTNVRQTRSADGVEVDGLYKGAPLHLTIVPQYNYLTTHLLLHPDGGRFGFDVRKVARFGAAWMPKSVDLITGDYKDGRITKGYTGHAEFADFAPHGAPTRREAPPIPAGSILGSEESRLYRVAQDGTLVDFGRAGYHPGAPLAWGDLFVLSGAGLLLGSLSWLVFRKRRTPSPLRGRGGRG